MMPSKKVVQPHEKPQPCARHILTRGTPFIFSRYENRQVTPDQLATLIRLQNDALLKVAAQVANVHEMVERLRSEWNSRTGQDPFEVSVDHVLLGETGKEGACVSFNSLLMPTKAFPHTRLHASSTPR